VGKPSSTTQNILIVDDEKLFLKSLREGLRPHAKKHNFRILIAEDGRKAIDVLEKEEVLALITDIKMPEIDGLQLIAYVMNRFPLLPVVVMTAYGSPQIKKTADDRGVLHYLEKPVDFDEIINIILELLKTGKRRIVQGVSLPSFLQLLEMEKTTCTIAASGEGIRGFMHIRDGRLLDARTERNSGMEAAMELLGLDPIEVEIREACPPLAGSAIGSLTEVLLEAFRIQDERRSQQVADAEELSIEIQEESSWDSVSEDSPPLQDVFELGEPVGEAGPPIAKANECKSIPMATESGIKEVPMNIPKLNKAIESLKESLGAALLTSDIFSTDDATSIAGWNSNPTACAVFSQFTAMVNRSLIDAKFPEIGRYYLLDLVDKKMVVVIPMGDFQWSMLIDGTKAQLGLLLNLAIPKAISAFEEAIVE